MVVAFACITGVAMRGAMTLAEVEHPMQLLAPDGLFVSLAWGAPTSWALLLGVRLLAVVRADPEWAGAEAAPPPSMAGVSQPILPNVRLAGPL